MGEERTLVTFRDSWEYRFELEAKAYIRLTNYISFEGSTRQVHQYPSNAGALCNALQSPHKGLLLTESGTCKREKFRTVTERLRSAKALLSNKRAMRVISCLELVNSAVGECGGCNRIDLLFPLTSKDLRSEIYFVPN